MDQRDFHLTLEEYFALVSFSSLHYEIGDLESDKSNNVHVTLCEGNLLITVT